MITLTGRPRRGFCDQISRRSFLTIGSFAGFSLADLLRAEAATGATSKKSVIMVFLPGGPPHQDMFDLKPEAPSEFRGEYRPISTNVPGVQICEHLPRLACMMDKLTIVRSVSNSIGRHESFQCMTGRPRNQQPPGGWPELGSIVTRLQGTRHPSVPAYVGLSPKMKHRPYNSGDPGCLGVAYAPFEPHGSGKSDLLLQDITLDRLDDRKHLLRSMDSFRRAAEGDRTLSGMDQFQQQAFGMLTSSLLAEALDVTREPQRTRDRYGYGTDKIQGDAAPRKNQQFLIARRLVEAGARCVTMSYSFWDWHGQTFRNGRSHLPDFDQGISALVEDLHARGLDRDVTVLVWGEFGRTPRINKSAGRDHWPQVSCALMAGGGMRNGQVIGSTDRIGAEPADRPVRFEEIHATLYRNLGLNPATQTFPDLTGRPHYLMPSNYHPLPELI